MFPASVPLFPYAFFGSETEWNVKLVTSFDCFHFLLIVRACTFRLNLFYIGRENHKNMEMNVPMNIIFIKPINGLIQ